MSQRIGVGFIGAGQATQAIHLPVLGSMADHFSVCHVADPDRGIGDAVAAPLGATVSQASAAVMDDDAVDVVVICSPSDLHAEHVIASCRAGKRAVLCEKPLAVTADELDAVLAAISASGTELFVGAMHAYDPAWRAARSAWASLDERVTFVGSTILLPSNAVYTAQATELVQPSAPAAPPRSSSQRPGLRDAVLGLAVHDVPLVRTFVEEVGTVCAAEPVQPFGYSIVHGTNTETVEWHAMMAGTWSPKWTLRVVGQAHELRLELPPSYVLGGSARAELITSRGSPRTTFESTTNGYQAQWADVHAVVARGAAPAVAADDAAADARWTIDLAHAVAIFPARDAA